MPELRNPMTQRLLPLLLVSSLGCAELQGLGLEELLQLPDSASETHVASGLREALRVGTERAVATLSEPGGFADVPALRLQLPEAIQPAAKTLRRIGMGRPVNELESKMNEAAERAAGEAIPVFADALTSMTISDAMGILNGPDDAATQYFQGRTSEALRARFRPVVEGAMQDVGVYRAYGEAKRLYESIPLTKELAPDLEGHILDSTLSGLFGTLAEEEARIREDPAARTTALLREVFGS